MTATEDMVYVSGVRLTLTRPEVTLLMGALASISMHTTDDRFDFAKELYTLLVNTLGLGKE